MVYLRKDWPLFDIPPQAIPTVLTPVVSLSFLLYEMEILNPIDNVNGDSNVFVFDMQGSPVPFISNILPTGGTISFDSYPFFIGEQFVGGRRMIGGLQWKAQKAGLFGYIVGQITTLVP